MYTNKQLEEAVYQRIFTESQVAEFKRLVAHAAPTAQADEEHFKLIGGFNDIFVVTACLLLILSVRILPIGNGILETLISITIVWGLSEFFVRKRKMAFPAVVLLLAFAGNLIAVCAPAIDMLFDSTNPMVTQSLQYKSTALLATLISTLSVWVYWLRFRVPLAISFISVGALLSLVMCLGLAINLAPFAKPIALLIGFILFGLALYWDTSDTQRISYQSDVGFWLHLVAAPLIIHPIYLSIGVFDTTPNILAMALALGLYFIISLVAIVIDRRALMLSALVYVIYSVATLIKQMGGVESGFAVVSAILGGGLLLLSAYWGTIRRGVTDILPVNIARYFPPCN